MGPAAKTVPEWDFRLLGGVVATQAGRKRSVPPRCQSLLVVLLLDARAHARSELVATLTPHLGQQGGRRSLSRRLWLLRDALPGVPLEAKRDAVRLRREERTLDVETFWGEVATQATWESALDRYRGDLAPLCGLAAVDRERKALRARYAEVGRGLAAKLLSAGEPRRALDWVSRVLQIDPLDEPALRILMRCQAESGQRREALEAFDRFRVRCDEAEMTPGRETAVLAEQIRRSEVAPSSESTTDARLTGDLRQADAALERGDLALARGLLRHAREDPDGRSHRRLIEARLAVLEGRPRFAEGLLRRGLSAVEGGAPEVLVVRAESAVESGDGDGAAVVAQAALQAGPEGRTRIQALIALAQAQGLRGRGTLAMASLSQAERSLAGASNGLLRCRLTLARADELSRQGLDADAFDAYRHVEEVATADSMASRRGHALLGMARSLGRAEEVGRALDTAGDALACFGEAGINVGAARAHTEIALLHERAGDLVAAGQAADDAVRAFERMPELVTDRQRALLVRTRIALRAGAEPREVLETARAVATTTRAGSVSAAAAEIRALALVAADDASRALPVLQEAQRRRELRSELSGIPALLKVKAEVLRRLSRHREAGEVDEQAALLVEQGVGQGARAPAPASAES